MMNILAIDPATRFGWAHGDDRGAVFLSGESHGEKLDCLYEWLTSFVTMYPVELIAFEDAGFASKHRETAAFHGELRGIILLFAERRGLATFRVNPSSLKKWATGNGRAEKRQMIQAMSTMFGLKIDDPDACDARWVLEYAKANWDKPPARSVKRRRAAAAKKEAKLFL
jgi:Holliday junction resolvasome RuvABC endonuclease subunit